MVNDQGQSEVIRCISGFQKPCISKWLVVERNGPKFVLLGKKLVSGPLIVYGYSEVIQCISDFRQPCILKAVGCRVKQAKFWGPRGKYLVSAGCF